MVGRMAYQDEDESCHDWSLEASQELTFDLLVCYGDLPFDLLIDFAAAAVVVVAY